MFNIDLVLCEIEVVSVCEGCVVGLDCYNVYCELVRFLCVTLFEQIIGDPVRIGALCEVYCSVVDVEFYLGLFVEDLCLNLVLLLLIGCMVGIDAFF